MISAAFGNPKYYRACGSYFGCGMPMENDENTRGSRRPRTKQKAEQLFKEAGYDWSAGHDPAADQLRRLQHRRPSCCRNGCERSASMRSSRRLRLGRRRHAGARCASRRRRAAGISSCNPPPPPPASNPIGSSAMRRTVRRGWFGWPLTRPTKSCATNGRKAEPQDRLAVAKEIERTPGTSCLHVIHGLIICAAGLARECQGRDRHARVIPFWNIEKT